MALTLPVTRDVVISEKRNYFLKYSFCNLGLVPSQADVIAFAAPLFSVDVLVQGFIRSATKIETRLFPKGQNLMRRTGTRLGKLNQFAQELEYPVLQYVGQSQWPSLPCSISGGVLTVTLPFGPTFYRYVDPVTGKMDKVSDLETINDPALYYYSVISKGVILAGGFITITIDLSVDVEDPVDTEPTICTVNVT